jgi:Ca2+-transporting ATPase
VSLVFFIQTIKSWLPAIAAARIVEKIPADGEVIRANDLCVDESSLTGEAEGVWKVTVEDSDQEHKDYWRRDYCYAGTLVTQGSATVRVEKIGSMTEYGKIGMNVANAPENPTPLQTQTSKLVKLCAGIAAILFALVSCITWFNIPDHMFKDRLIDSILSGVRIFLCRVGDLLRSRAGGRGRACMGDQYRRMDRGGYSNICVV